MSRPATRHALAATPGHTYNERLSNLLAALEARVGHIEVREPLGADDGPSEPVVADVDGDRAASVDEGFTERQMWGGAR